MHPQLFLSNFTSALTDKNSPVFIHHAKLIIKILESLGIRSAFGVTGGAIVTIFGALSESTQIETIHAQHEGSAAYMALGRGLVSRGTDLPLIYATAGPGILNLASGLAAAWEECVPILAITGNVSRSLFGKGAAQDSSPLGIDAVKALAPVTAESVMVERSEDLIPTLLRLVDLARRTRKPVHLNVPVDLASSPAPSREEIQKQIDDYFATIQAPSRGEESEISSAIDAFLGTERPLIFAGHGIKLSGLEAKLIKLAEAMQSPVVTTSHAKGIMPESHPLNMGCFGLAATPRAEGFLKDYRPTGILFLGTRLGEPATSGWSPLLSEPALRVHVDEDRSQFNRVMRVTHPVCSSIEAFAESMLARIPAARTPFQPCHELERGNRAFTLTGPIHPIDLMKALEFYLPENATIFTDIGNSMAWAIHALSIQPSQRFFIPLGLGAMGSGICSAIGAQTLEKERPVVCITGDAAMLMHGNELFTASERGLNVKVIVLNDGGHGMVDHGHRILNVPSKGLRFKNRVDFTQIAAGLSIPAHRADSLGQLLELPLEDLFTQPGPMLFDLSIDRDAVPPILSRTRVIGQSDALA